MLGQMMDMPLLVSSILRHAARHYGQTEVVSRRVEGDIHRYTYAHCEQRSRQLASALQKAGIGPGERVWNGIAAPLVIGPLIALRVGHVDGRPQRRLRSHERSSEVPRSIDPVH